MYKHISLAVTTRQHGDQSTLPTVWRARQESRTAAWWRTSTWSRQTCDDGRFILMYLRSIVKLIITTYFNHSGPLIPDGIHLIV